MLALLKRMGNGQVIARGFRSTFKDWTGETTALPDDLSEGALAHRIRDKTKAACKRGTMPEKGRILMDKWAAYAISLAL